MDAKLMQLIYHTVQAYNILPITSVCNVRCVFCSHRQNPPGVKAVAVPPLSLAVIENLVEFLDKKKKIVIGESASLIMEGEPFTHPYFFEVLHLIREKCPETLIQLTTNGSYLDEKVVEKLKSYGLLEINLSLNAGSMDLRQQLMQDKRAGTACNAPKFLKEAGVNYHGSIVAMPHITGWDALYETIKELSRQGAQTVRIFKPGFTKFAPPQLALEENIFSLLEEKIDRWRQGLCPVTLEPSNLDNLQAEVIGAIKNTPAEKAGIKPGDIITKINGQKPFSRVEAFAVLQKNGKHALEIKRDGQVFNQILEVTDKKSGLVFDYDISLAKVRDIRKTLEKFEPARPLLLASKLGYSILKEALKENEGVEITSVPNKYFGGNIGCAGLLVVEDFKEAYFNYVKTKPQPDLVLLPAISFDPWERDLTGKGIWELEETVGCKCVVL